MNNVFNTPAFSMAALTSAINIIPNRYGRMEALNLFPAKPVRTRQVIVEEQNGVLNLLPTMPVGSPGTVGTRGKRTVRSDALAGSLLAEAAARAAANLVAVDLADRGNQSVARARWACERAEAAAERAWRATQALS